MVEYAKLLLRDEDVSVTYVAEAAGFANANYSETSGFLLKI